MLIKVHPLIPLQAAKVPPRASSSGVNCQQNIHRLDLGPLLTGIARSSVRMHRYSPITAIKAMQAILTSHQESVAGR